MFQNFYPKFALEIFFFVIFIFTIYYTYSKNFKERNFGLVLTSFVQGLLLSVIFPEYLLFASILALVYYIFFSNFWQIKFLMKSHKLDAYNDEELFHFLTQISEIKNFEFEFKKYSGKNSLNANVIPPIPFISKNRFKISFGEELISKLTLGEKVFVLAHEISHALNKHFLKKSVLICSLFVGLIFVSLIYNIIVLNFARSYFVQLDYIGGFSLFMIGIIGMNLISWYYEYDADKKALQLTKDINSFESTLAKLEEVYPFKDYGIFINLIVYTHPITNNRIKRGKESNFI